jgi:SAM-dependent methyltransferase
MSDSRCDSLIASRPSTLAKLGFGKPSPEYATCEAPKIQHRQANLGARLHPLAEYPLAGLKRVPQCSVPRSDPAYLNALMVEASLLKCQQYVRGRLLDVGCGRKPYKDKYFSAAASYIGVDYLTDRSQPDIVASALDLPLDSESFDTVVSTEVLEHVPDPLRALREMHRVLKPSGYLILSTPMYWPRHEVPYDFFRYPYDGLIYLIKESGLELVRIFNRGHAYVFLGQVIQHTLPVFIRFRFLRATLNSFFLWCDRHHAYDAVTIGWTVVARRNA